MNKLIKTVALASTLVLATTAGAFASTAWIKQDTDVKKKPFAIAQTIAHADKGEKVWIDNCNVKFCFVKRPGKDGWVRKNALTNKKPFQPFNGQFGNSGFSFCVGDANAQFCLNGNQ